MTVRIAFGAAIAICALALAGCGGDTSTTTTPTAVPQSSTRLSFLDISSGQTPAESPTPTPARSAHVTALVGVPTQPTPTGVLDGLGNVLMFRLIQAGLSNIGITQPDERDMTIDFTGTRSADFVKQVIEAQNLNFRQPIIQANGDVTCKTNGGVEFSVQAWASNVHDVTDNAGTRSVNCTAADGQSGTLEWVPAQADVNGATKTLTQAMIDASKVEITSTPQQGTVLLLTFTPEGTSLFAALTGRLVHYPLAIFLGNALLAAPTVATQVTSSEVQITGASDDELDAAKAVIKGGELPAPVSVTSIVPN